MDAIFSKAIKAKDRTYFVDVKETKNNSRYLTLAESKPSKDGEKKFTRSSIAVFESNLEEFRQAIEEAYAQLK